MKDVTLNQKEQARLSVLNSVLEYQVPIAEAAELLGVTQRHARRMLAAYREGGAAALAHGNRGRRPHNATAPGEAAVVVQLATERYEGANHTHLTELLSEREGIDLRRPTVRRILTKAEIGSPRSRRSPQHRFRRQRMPQAGLLVQLDGSHHAWLEDRGPKFALLLAVDDATSAVVNAVFCTSETTAGYFMLLEGLIEGWGIPLALYSDRHAVFKHNARKPETAAEATQFTRSLQELGIRQIFARFPQAEGRVKRAAGTFQDRLVTELRLSDARTMDQATAVLQDFLPRYNARFAVQPDHPEPAYRPVDPDLILSEILCFKDTRKVARDNTVQYNWRTLQLLPSAERPSYAGVQVEVLEHPDGRLQVRHEGEIIPSQSAPPRPGALRASHGALAPTPEISRIVKRLGNHRLSQPQLRNLANLDPDPIAEDDDQVANSECETQVPEKRPLSPRQLALWRAVQEAKVQGISLREIARQLGISRNTVRKYARALTQPTNRPTPQP